MGASLFKCNACNTLSRNCTPSCLACDTPNSLVKAPKGTRMPRKKYPPTGVAGERGFGAFSTDEGSEDDESSSNARSSDRDADPSDVIDDVELVFADRVSTGLKGFNRVLGKNRGAGPDAPYGAARGGCVIISGEPGIGKSTLLIQTVRMMASQGVVLYATGEQSKKDVRVYAESFGTMTRKQRRNFRILESNSTDDLIEEVNKHKPLVLIIDSLQTFSSDNVNGEGGSKSQAVYMRKYLIVGATQPLGVVVFIVSQVNKDNQFAGSNANAHLADAMLSFESEDEDDPDNPYRFLIARRKNRHGQTGVPARFRMGETGLVGIKIKKKPKKPKRSKKTRRHRS